MKDSPSQRFLTASFDGPLRKDPKEGGAVRPRPTVDMTEILRKLASLAPKMAEKLVTPTGIEPVFQP
jgi:hypothetical protein